MKITSHIATGNFEFLEAEQEVGTLDEAVDAYHSLKNAFNSPVNGSGEGLDQKEWNRVLDGYLTVGAMPGEAYQRMSQKQIDIIQEIKKSMARLNPRETRPPRIN